MVVLRLHILKHKHACESAIEVINALPWCVFRVSEMPTVASKFST